MSIHIYPIIVDGNSDKEIIAEYLRSYYIEGMFNYIITTYRIEDRNELVESIFLLLFFRIIEKWNE